MNKSIRNKYQNFFCIAFFLSGILAISQYFSFYIENDYLPSPFIADKFDTFMDFFNPLWWSSHFGVYDDWRSVYPPLNFLFLRLVDQLFKIYSCDSPDPFSLRDQAIILKYFLILFYFLIPFSFLKTSIWSRFSNFEKILLYFGILLSPPMLFSLERGNLILLTLPLLGLFFTSKSIVRSFSLGLLVNLKPYLIFLFLGDLIKKRWSDLLLTCFFSCTIFFFSALFVSEKAYLIVPNLLNFGSSNNLFSPYDILTFPSSLSAFSYILNYPKFDLISLPIREALVLGIESLKWMVISVLIVIIILCKDHLESNTIILFIISILTNIGISTGGYALIFYITFIPLIFNMRYRSLLLSIILIIFAPLDAISIYSVDLPGTNNIYLSESTVQSLTWNLTLGAVLKPLLNFVLLIIFTAELYFYVYIPKIKKG